MIQCETIAESAILSIKTPPGMEGHRIKIIIIDKEANPSPVDNVESMRKELAGLLSPMTMNWNRDDINDR